MPVQITIPSPGESITEVTLGPWHAASGTWVSKDDTLVEIESDKVTLEVPSPESGLLTVQANEGDEMTVGDVIGMIDTDAEAPADGGAPAKAAAASTPSPADTNEVATETASATTEDVRATPLARKIAAAKGVNLATVPASGPSGRVSKADVVGAITPAAAIQPTTASPEPTLVATGTRGVRRQRMSKLRQRIAERLVEAKHTTAMLTTFNEADMTEVMRLRKLHKEAFTERHGVGLGFMSFFVKACTSALQQFPEVNAYIDGDEIEYHDYCDISIAVGTDKGLVVPVLRDAELLSFAGIEQGIKTLALKARDNKLTIDDMTGGTFTISNGGVYGSLNSTPILNPPQSGILGMHKIQKRPVEDPSNPGQVTLRPMMYLAMSYDHRIVDGAGAVGFLVHVKECLENPEKLLLGL